MTTTTCDKCKFKFEISEVIRETDFHGNTIGFFCSNCGIEVMTILEQIFFTFGGYKTKRRTIMSSPKGSPHIRNYREFMEVYNKYISNRLLELKQHRYYERKSINRHSNRVYIYEGSYYLLDRTTDTNPRFFTLWAIEALYINGYFDSWKVVGKPIPVDGSEYWGDNFSWSRAEKNVMKALEEL